MTISNAASKRRGRKPRTAYRWCNMLLLARDLDAHIVKALVASGLPAEGLQVVFATGHKFGLTADPKAAALVAWEEAIGIGASFAVEFRGGVAKADLVREDQLNEKFWNATEEMRRQRELYD